MPLFVSQQSLEPRLRLFVSLVVHGNQQRQPVSVVAHIGGHHRNWPRVGIRAFLWHRALPGVADATMDIVIETTRKAHGNIVVQCLTCMLSENGKATVNVHDLGIGPNLHTVERRGAVARTIYFRDTSTAKRRRWEAPPSVVPSLGQAARPHRT